MNELDQGLTRDGEINLGRLKCDVFVGDGTDYVDFHLKKQPQLFGRHPVDIYTWDCALGTGNTRPPDYHVMQNHFTLFRLTKSGNVNRTRTRDAERRFFQNSGIRNTFDIGPAVDAIAPPLATKIDWSPFAAHFNARNKVKVVAWYTCRYFILRTQRAPGDLYIVSVPKTVIFQMIITGHCEAELENPVTAPEGNVLESAMPEFSIFYALLPLAEVLPPETTLSSIEADARNKRREEKRRFRRRQRGRDTHNRKAYGERHAAKD